MKRSTSKDWVLFSLRNHWCLWRITAIWLSMPLHAWNNGISMFTNCWLNCNSKMYNITLTKWNFVDSPADLLGELFNKFTNWNELITQVEKCSLQILIAHCISLTKHSFCEWSFIFKLIKSNFESFFIGLFWVSFYAWARNKCGKMCAYEMDIFDNILLKSKQLFYICCLFAKCSFNNDGWMDGCNTINVNLLKMIIVH